MGGRREREKGNKRVTEMYIVSTYCIPGNFVSQNFHEYDDFNNFTKNIFANDPRGQHKRCGMAIFRGI